MDIMGPSEERNKPKTFNEVGSGQLTYRFPGAVDPASTIPMFEHWGESLRVFEAELEGASAQSDEEFMGIGAKLDDFHSRAVNIFSMSSAAAGLLRGSEIRDAIDGLKDMLETVRNGIAGSEHDIERFVESFGQVLHTVHDMRDRLANIDSVCRGLRKHSTTMKIYSAQLAVAASDFGALAEDVKKLSDTMEARTTGISAELKVLSAQVSRTIADIRKLGEKHRSETGEVIRRIGESVASLNEKHETAASVAAEIREMSREISSHIEDIVTSVQFHDITNQQLQRAKATICNLRGMIEAVASAESMLGREGFLQTINAAGFACGIEADHLSSAESELNRAVKEIVVALGVIGEGISEMSEMVMETSLNSGDSLLEDIKGGLSAVSAAFLEITKNKKEFSSAAESAFRIEGKIQSFMSDIEEIGDDINIIALNAAIKAAQIGDKGATVSIIANSMQRVLAEAQGLTDAVRECDFSVDLGCNESDGVDNVTESLQLLLGSINEVDDDLSEITRGLRIESRALSEDIGAMTEDLSVHEKLSTSIDRVATGLVRIMKDCEPFFSTGHFSTENFDRDALEAQLNGVGDMARPVLWKPEPDSVVSLQRVHEQGGTVEFF